MQGNEVNTDFEILLEEIELLANQLHKDGAQAFKEDSYDTARRAIEEATHLAEFREKVKALQKEWASLLAKRPRRPKKAGRVVKSRLARGLRTPEDTFRQPILEALVALGGKLPVSEVLPYSATFTGPTPTGLRKLITEDILARERPTPPIRTHANFPTNRTPASNTTRHSGA